MTSPPGSAFARHDLGGMTWEKGAMSEKIAASRRMLFTSPACGEAEARSDEGEGRAANSIVCTFHST
jgi:hypothetical protein